MKLEKEKKQLLFILGSLLVLYLTIGFLKPIGDDEALYINAGKGIIKGEYDFTNYWFTQTWSPPFTYITGSPLAPIIYGTSYLIGGIKAVRIIIALVMIFSLFTTYLIIKKRKSDWKPTLILLGIGISTIMIASEAYLDGIALLFMVLGIYFYDSEKMLHAGIFFGLAATTKYMLIIPIMLLGIYTIFKKKKWYLFAIGGGIISIIYLFFFWQMTPHILGFIFKSRIHNISTINALTKQIILGIPLITLILLVKVRKWKWDYLWIIFASLWLYHIINLDSNALIRHMPYMEFAATIMLSAMIPKINKIKLWQISIIIIYLIIVIYMTMNSFLYTYENVPENHLLSEGNKLVVTANKYALITGASINYSASNIYTNDLFDEDWKNGSQIDDFERAINNNYFAKIFIFAYETGNPKYDAIRQLTLENYCPVYAETKSHIHVYEPCN